MARGSGGGGSSHSGGGSSRSSGSGFSRGSSGHSSSGFRNVGSSSYSGGGGSSRRPIGSRGPSRPPMISNYGYDGHHRPPRPPRPPRYGYYGGYGYDRRPVYVERRSGCLTNIVVDIFVGILLLMIIINVFSNFGAKSTNGITKSTIQREKSSPASVNVISTWYGDDMGGIENRAKLESGLKYFYNKTGVQPYVYITNDGSFDESDLSNLYDELFTDSGHLLVCIRVNGSCVDWEDCDLAFEVGNAAATVFDSEAEEIFRDYFSKNWDNSSLSNSEFISNTFTETTDRIMEITPNSWNTAITAGIVLVIIVIAFIWWKKHKEQKNIEDQNTINILNSNINSNEFQDPSLNDLENKYQ